MHHLPTRGTGTGAVLTALGFAVLVGCGRSDHLGFAEGADAMGATDQDGGPTAPNFAGLDGAADAKARPPVVGWLKGKVVAPEGTVPISNALVYLTSRDAEVIPAGVFCDTCVHLSALEPYAYTKSDGSFELGAYAVGMQHLVVQKGQFRRIRNLNVSPGDQAVPADFTRLPGKTNASAGDTIPKIGMVNGGYDHIDFTLQKLGIEEFFRYGDGPVTIGATPPGIKTGKTAYDLIQNATELGLYHIALMPCASLGYQMTDNGNVCGTPIAPVQTALKSYVDVGGKLYVTDYAYETVRQTWPGFVTFYDYTMQPLVKQSAGLGTACRAGSETTSGTAQDPGLADWMKTIGETNISLQASWTRIQKVTPQPGFDGMGKAVTITPKVWMTSSIAGAELPATVSFEQKCGRVLFSTYHCEGDNSSKLLAQEKALLYVLLEVGVCVGELPPPPPPR